MSRTLQSITATKIQELERQRRLYEDRKKEGLNELRKKPDHARARVSELLACVSDLRVCSSQDLGNLRRWINQAEYDPSVGETALKGVESTLRSKLDIGSRKLDLADLYSRMLTEWIDSANQVNIESPSAESTTLDDDFEMVQSRQKERLQQLRDKFEQVVFEPLQTNETEIQRYLEKLFVGHTGEKALDWFRERMRGMGKNFLEETTPFDEKTLRWCIKALLRQDLLNDEKKATLQDFLRDEAVLAEIRDVLNMRYRDLRNWSWNLWAQGMRVEP